jgi:glutamate carboxypeptidase
MLEALRQLVEAESPSTDKQACDNCADRVVDVFGRSVSGITTERHRQAERGDHVELRLGQADKPILLLCHHDTVWDRGTLERLPFVVDNNVVRGPGAFDMKAGIVEAAFALRASRTNRAVVVLSTSDEEVGSGSSRSLIEDRAREASAVLVLEPATSGGAIKTARKGIADFRIRVTGRAAHAGVEPEKGVSAIEEASDIVLRLRKLADPNRGTTINVGVFRGGTRPNVVAAQAELQVDVRLASKAESDRVLPAIEQLRPELPGARVEILGGLDRPPMERTEGIVRLARLAQEIAAELGFELKESSTGGGSDGNFTAALGVPTLDGLGPDGGGAHSDSEHLLIDSWLRRTALLARLLETL